MPIYNPLSIGKTIEAGAGVAFSTNPATGAVIISTAGGSSVVSDELTLSSAGTSYGITLQAPAGISASAIYNLPASVGNQGNLLIINNIVGGVANLVWASAAGSGFIVGVTGTTDRIYVNNTSPYEINPLIDISANYAGQSSINTVGTITSGTWNATNLSESQITNLTSDLAAKADLVGGALNVTQIPTAIPLTINSKTTSNNTISLSVNDIPGCESLSNKNIALGYCPLNASILVPTENIPELAESKITNLVSDLAACEKSANKNVANGYAPLDANGYLPLANLGRATSNTITFYVDSKFTGAANDGSILKPYTTIMAAVNAIGGSPVDNTDTHLKDRFMIYVTAGQYDEDIVLPGSRHITLCALGMVVLGDGATQYFATSTTPRNVTLNLFRNTAQSTTFYRQTYILTSIIPTVHGASYIHEGLEAGWNISGIINIRALTGSASSDTEIQLNQVCCMDQSATGHFINNTSTATSWTGNINVRCVGCRGNGVNFAYSANFPNFNLCEVTECYFLNILNVGRMGLMSHTTLGPTSGFSAKTLIGINSTSKTYYSQMIDCSCKTGSSFSTTDANTLYVDNATWVNSGGTITTAGSLTLNIDYGFPNKRAFTSLSDGQVISWNAASSQFINTTPSSGVTALSALSDCTTSGVANDQVLIYTTASSLNKWTPYTLTGAVFDDAAKTITVAAGGVTSAIATTGQTTVSSATGSVTFGLANNAVLPGSSGVTLPQGATSARAGTSGTVRFNSQTTEFEGTADGANWSTFLSNTSTAGVVNDQVLVYTTASSLNKWTPYTLSGVTFDDASKTITVTSGSSALSELTDCSTSSVANDQVLVYTTDSALNKWTPYTISGATFDDATKTIAISASGSSSISTLTDVSLTSLAPGNMLMYNGTSWVNSEAIPDNFFIVKDDIVGTKRFQIQCSNITAGQTRILYAPDYSGYIVGSTNAATSGHVLMGDVTTPVWAQLTTQNIGNMITAGALNNSTLVYNSTTLKWEHSTVLTSIQSSLGPLNSSVKPYGGGFGGAGIANNATFTMQNYIDNTDGTMFNQYTLSSTLAPITAFNCSTNLQPYLSISANAIATSGGVLNYQVITSPERINIDYGTARVFVSFYFWINGVSTSGALKIYLSNSVNSYNDISPTNAATDPNLVLAYSRNNTSGSFNATVQSSDTTNSYRYVHFVETSPNGAISILNAYANYGSLAISNLTQGTDYTLTSAPANGYPMITNLRGTTIQGYYNVLSIIYNTMFTRVYPVVFDANNIRLGGQTGWNIQNNSSNLLFNYNGATKYTIDSSGNTTMAGTLTIPDNLFIVKDNADGTKKLQFELTNITSGQTRIITVPNYSANLVGASNTSTNGYVLTATGDANTVPAWAQLPAYAPSSAPIFTNGIFFDSSGDPGWNIGTLSSTTATTAEFSVSNNFVAKVLSILGNGNTTISGNLTVNGTITNYLTSATAASTYAPLNNPTFTGGMNFAPSYSFGFNNDVFAIQRAGGYNPVWINAPASTVTLSNDVEVTNHLTVGGSIYLNLAHDQWWIQNIPSDGLLFNIQGSNKAKIKEDGTIQCSNLTVSGSITNYSTTAQMNTAISTAVGSATNNLSVDFVKYILISDYAGYAYTSSFLIHSYVVDISGAGLVSQINLPSHTTLTDQQVFYFQFVNSTSNTCRLAGSDFDYVWWNAGAGGGNYYTTNTGVTLKATFFSSSPYSAGSNVWVIETVASNHIPLKNNIGLYCIQSTNNNMLGAFDIPSNLSFGQQMYFKDTSGYLNASHFQLNGINSNTIVGIPLLSLNTANSSTHLCYIGGGSGGDLILL